MLAVIGLMLIIAQLSLSISNQADRIKILTQGLGCCDGAGGVEDQAQSHGSFMAAEMLRRRRLRMTH